jgi:predicted Zn-dependent protease
VLSLGLLWIGIALLPVSNIFTATGVVLAERALFMPSAGAMLAIGAMLAPVFAGEGRIMARRTVVAGVAILVLLGLARTMERQTAWKTPEEFANRLLRDGPTTYRAHLVASSYYAREGRLAEAERTAKRALALYQGDPQIYEHLGQLLRRDGRCLEALPLLTEAVRRFPDQTIARSRMIECTLAVGDSTGALMLAEEAVSTGHREFEQTVRRLSRPR